MSSGYHFISGLPRSGSTLLAALLRPTSAGITGPLCAMVDEMSADSESAIFFTQVEDPRGIGATEFDARLGTPGQHDLRPRAGAIDRKIILPPNLWERSSIRRMPEFNTPGTPVGEHAEAPR